ncbi:hypothetical protein L1049_013848 [Liquidambar formosana]|uniref:Uncharacterized protein n=1 Tax=Liquidambar formosana TaxID=63359 RepID=A0AAP0RL01_LIQFO
MKSLVITSDSPTSISGLISIRQLNLERCNLSYIPDELGSLTSLGRLCLRGNNFRTLPASISHLSNLWNLDLSGCIRLQSIPAFPVGVINVAARYCTLLERISIRSDFLDFPGWSFPGCCKLVKNNIGSNVGQNLLDLCVFDFMDRGFCYLNN